MSAPAGAFAGQKILVTGGAGFIGSHAVDALAATGAQVTVLDDLSTGDEAFLADSRDSITFEQGDVGDTATLDRLLPGMDQVWHLAADPEVRKSGDDPRPHFRTNVEATLELLMAMQRHGVPRLLFTSTSTVYGEASVKPTPEDYGPLYPISVYGGCKLACEALVAAYCGSHGLDAAVMRFANVVGPRSNHGVTYDFVRKLRADPERLEILGDGSQAKSYVSVADTVAGMMHAAQHSPAGCHAYNVGSLDAIPVTVIADEVAAALDASPEFAFTGGGAHGGAGWKGDVKNMALAVDKLRALGPGWEPRQGSRDAIRATADWLTGQKLPPLPAS
ncbi:MAG: NAD-dependent epimerase/dehydratase family protein [Thermoplasmatota archaeon]